MHTFKVWDALNSEESEAKEIQATCVERAAEKYAEDDKDGQCDDIYQYGHPIRVKDPSGDVYTVDISVEMTPTFWGSPPKKDGGR